MKHPKTLEERDSLKYFVREKERITYWIAREKTEIKTLIALLFPELERKSGIFSKEIRALFLHFGSAHKIRTTPKEQFLKIAETLSLITEESPHSLLKNSMNSLTPRLFMNGQITNNSLNSK